MPTYHTVIDADGSLVLPPALLAALGLRAGDRLAIESDGDSLLVRRAEARDAHAGPD